MLDHQAVFPWDGNFSDSLCEVTGFGSYTLEGGRWWIPLNTTFMKSKDPQTTVKMPDHLW